MMVEEQRAASLMLSAPGMACVSLPVALDGLWERANYIHACAGNRLSTAPSLARIASETPP